MKQTEEAGRGTTPPTSEVLRVARDATENAMQCYRDAATAKAAGDELEARELLALAERSLDLARDLLCRLEGLA